MIARPFKQMHELGVLGINRRNGDFIQRYNPRKLFPLVDDKLLTKSLAINAAIAVPELFHVVNSEHEILALSEVLKKFEKFVVKPSHGSGGDGILVIDGRRQDCYQLSNGALMSQEQLNFHVSNILSGMYSLGGHPDKAMFEYRVQFDPIFENISYMGVPDIRVIVFLGYPVMAMVRLPTRGSQGKANLHQGAIGAGIDLATGRTGHGVWNEQITECHPDTGKTISTVQIPGWDRLLEIAAGCYELTDIGYLGVDLVLDQERGPLMLELNARPGLSIQIANQKGLLPRLRSIEAQVEGLGFRANVPQRIDFVRQHSLIW